MKWWPRWTRAISPNWYPEIRCKDHRRLRQQKYGVRHLHTKKIKSVMTHIGSRGIDCAPYLAKALIVFNDNSFSVSSPTRSISVIYAMSLTSNSWVRTLPATKSIYIYPIGNRTYRIVLVPRWHLQMPCGRPRSCPASWWRAGQQYSG